MAIQFRCPGCEQPIEVDDVHANQSATCPYCRRVITVPPASQLDAQPAAARPVAPRPETGGFSDAAFRPAPPPPIPEQLHVGPTLTYRDQLARTYGNYALVCTALLVAIFLGTMIYSYTAALETFRNSTTSQPYPSAAEIEKFSADHPGMLAGSLGSLFFGIVGLALGITSVKQSTRENWRGFLSTVVCGLFVLFFCLINAAGLFIGGFGGMGS